MSSSKLMTITLVSVLIAVFQSWGYFEEVLRAEVSGVRPENGGERLGVPNRQEGP
jgi:hypothetical protein